MQFKDTGVLLYVSCKEIQARIEIWPCLQKQFHLNSRLHAAFEQNIFTLLTTSSCLKTKKIFPLAVPHPPASEKGIRKTSIRFFFCQKMRRLFSCCIKLLLHYIYLLKTLIACNGADPCMKKWGYSRSDHIIAHTMVGSQPLNGRSATDWLQQLMQPFASISFVMLRYRSLYIYIYIFKQGISTSDNKGISVASFILYSLNAISKWFLCAQFVLNKCPNGGLYLSNVLGKQK